MADASKPARRAPSSSSSPVKNGYLVLYNAVSAALWAVVLGRALAAAASGGSAAVYPAVGEFCKWTQTLAGMEVLHSLLGIVRSPLVTTFMQVFSRYAIVWGVTGPFPPPRSGDLGSSSGSGFGSGLLGARAYLAMLVAWGATEVIRYGYFALTLSSSSSGGGGGTSSTVTRALHWLRYHAFFVLYPLGISSEAVCLWLAGRGPANRVSPLYANVLLAYVVLVYPPSAYILYSHMMAQRRKVMKAWKAESSKAQ
ncbi:PTPLA-domain-containing protein [Xylariaceae sp. FL0804]|nr:PTPLA-domain-containing protein [Xylariaceae sp. FL0804]